jgi:hypothetical protein
VATNRQPVVEVIGREDSQIVLIDTGRHRILVFSGPLNIELAGNLATMMGMLRRRIDILFAAESAIANSAREVRSQWKIGTTASLPEQELPISPHAELTVHDPVSISLSADVEFRLVPHFRSTKNSSGTDPGWRIEVQRGDQTIAIARSLDDLTAVPCGPFAVAIAPNGSVRLAERKSLAGTYAMNERSIDSNATSPQLTRIFEYDVAQFQMKLDSIVVPPWTTAAHRQS